MPCCGDRRPRRAISMGRVLIPRRMLIARGNSEAKRPTIRAKNKPESRQRSKGQGKSPGALALPAVAAALNGNVSKDKSTTRYSARESVYLIGARKRGLPMQPAFGPLRSAKFLETAGSVLRWPQRTLVYLMPRPHLDVEYFQRILEGVAKTAKMNAVIGAWRRGRDSNP